VTPLLHVVLPGEPEPVQEAMVEVSRRTGVWLGRAQPGPREGTSKVEVAVAGRSLEVPAQEGAALLAEVAGLVAAGAGQPGGAPGAGGPGD